MLRTILTLDEIVEVTGGALVDGPQIGRHSGEEIVTCVSTDTRSLLTGSLFVAIKGATFDGHDFLTDAVRAGASALLVDRALPKTAPHVPHVVVMNTTQALGDIARYVRDAFAGNGPVVGVTGSVGKTTTKELIALALSPSFQVCKTELNHNNEIGVPQTIFRAEPQHGALVIEMGMRAASEILRLCEIAAPTVGVVTNVGYSHIERLGDQASIARAKGELLESLPSNGLAVLPAGDPFGGELRRRFAGRTLLCALENADTTNGSDEAVQADVRASGITRHENGWRFTAKTPWGKTKMFLPTAGRFNVLNALFAISVACEAGVELEAVARALNRFTPPPMRMETKPLPGGGTLLLDMYNAAPDSMLGALETLRDTPTGSGGKRVAILGEMKELGDLAPQLHKKVGEAAARDGVDVLAVVGGVDAQSIADGAVAAGFPKDRTHFFAASAELAQALTADVNRWIPNGSAVLLKGSRAVALEQVASVLQPTQEGPRA